MEENKTKYDILVEGLNEAVKAGVIEKELIDALVGKAEQEGTDEGTEKKTDKNTGKNTDKSATEKFIEAFTNDIKH